MLKELWASIISFFMSYKSQIICVLIGIFIKEIWLCIKNTPAKIKQLMIKDYYWQPKEPLYNKYADEDVNRYRGDIRIGCKNKLLDIESPIEGEECFIQHLTTFIKTPKGEYITDADYGNEFAETIFDEKDVVEFQRQCEKLAKDILESESYIDYIEKIYCIYRKKSDLYIEMKLCGNPKTVTCKVPNKCKS